MSDTSDFRKALEESTERSKDPKLDKIYDKIFLGFSHSEFHDREPTHPTSLQLRGVDKTVYVTRGVASGPHGGPMGRSYNVYTVDEKIVPYPDDQIFLEYLSDNKRLTPGWVCDPKKICDYVVFVKGNKTAYAFPYPPLVKAWERYGSEWKERYGPKYVKNETWWSEGTVVPASEIYKAISEVLVVDLD